MAARAAIALCLTALAWAGTVRAQDNPACAQYREPMAYNACLAQHGPKANGVGQLHGRLQPGNAAPNRIRTDTAAPRKSGFIRTQDAAAERASTIRKAPSASMDVYIWSFGSIERGLQLASATPEPAEIAQAPRSLPRAVGDQRGDRASRQAPRRGGAGFDLEVNDRGSRMDPLALENEEGSRTCSLYDRMQLRL